MLDAIQSHVDRARTGRKRWLLIVNLRIFLAFAMLPAGLKKVLGEPFTDPLNVGPFHDFLDAFHGTGALYFFVGATQLLASTLLFSQRYAAVGTLLLFPILTVILVFCWGTHVPFTASVVTLMWLGSLLLLLWDIRRWAPMLRAEEKVARHKQAPRQRPVDLNLWALCGFGIFAIYLASCAAYGGVYRPKGMAWDTPAFYVFPVLLLAPLATWWIDRRRYRARAPERRAAGDD